MLKTLPADPKRADAYKHTQRHAHQQRGAQQNQVNRDGVAVEDLMAQILQRALAEVEKSSKADCEAVDDAKVAEAENLGGVVGDRGVVEGPVEREEDDVCVRGPDVGQAAEDADYGGDGDEAGEHEEHAGVVEHHADEGDGAKAADGQRDIEEGVDLDGFLVRAEDVLVLWADGGDEVVDARHLDDGEECDEDEPRRADLLLDCLAVHGSPYAGDLVLVLFLLQMLLARFRAEQACDFRDDGFLALSSLVAEESGCLVHLVLEHVVRLFHLRDQLPNGLV